MLCWQPFGRPVVPLVYIKNSGASAGIDTGSTVLPRVFGYLGLLLGATFVIAGVASLASLIVPVGITALAGGAK